MRSKGTFIHPNNGGKIKNVGGIAKTHGFELVDVEAFGWKDDFRIKKPQGRKV